MDLTTLAPQGRMTAGTDGLRGLHGREVVVGYDATPAADAAVRWAAVEAARLHSPLTVVCAVDPGLVGGAHTSAPELARVGRELAHRGAEVARSAVPDSLPARVVGTIGGAAGELVARSAAAALLVVGAPRLRGAAALGSVSFGVTLHARCPVVLVPGDADRHPGPDSETDVVVGVDGSRGSRSAVETAAQLALARGGRLRVVTAWQSASVRCPAAAGRGGAHDEDGLESAVRREAAHHDVEAVLAQVRRDHPGLDVSGLALEGRPVDVLTGCADEAGLLVVGSRGHGGFAGLALGSVCHAVVRSAQVPVAVVRQGWW